MVSALIERRLERLEQVSGGGDECPRCKGTMIVVDTSGEISVTKDGSRLTPEAAKAFYRAELPHGQCPVCEGYRRKVVIRWGPGSSYARKPGL